MPWISVRGWRKFQHYDPDKRVPPWIKNNTDLMSNDDYLTLTEHRALMLHRLWLEYASSRCQLRVDTVSTSPRPRFDTVTLSRRLGMRVTTADLVSLSDAGFIDIVASKALAEGYQSASARARAVETETEVEKEIDLPPLHPVARGVEGRNGNHKDDDIPFDLPLPTLKDMPA